MVAGRGSVGGQHDWLGYVTGLACSVTYALSMILMRREHGPRRRGGAGVRAEPLGLPGDDPGGVATWVAPSTATVVLFAAAGLLGTAGHLAMAFAYGRAPASRLAPLEYTAFLWASAFGLAFFGEIPSP